MPDPVFLPRLQYALLIAFHLLLRAFTVGLASYIAVLEGLYLWTWRSAKLGISRASLHSESRYGRLLRRRDRKLSA